MLPGHLCWQGSCFKSLQVLTIRHVKNLATLFLPTPSFLLFILKFRAQGLRGTRFCHLENREVSTALRDTSK